MRAPNFLNQNNGPIVLPPQRERESKLDKSCQSLKKSKQCTHTHPRIRIVIISSGQADICAQIYSSIATRRHFNQNVHPSLAILSDIM